MILYSCAVKQYVKYIVIFVMALFIGGVAYIETTPQALREAFDGRNERAVQEMPQREAGYRVDGQNSASGNKVTDNKAAGASSDALENESQGEREYAADNQDNSGNSVYSSSRGGGIHSQIFTVTAYSPNEESTGKAPGHPLYKRTATGTTTTEGRTIAADFQVLPPGTVVWIEGIGRRVVEDCGGAVKGNHIDLYFESASAAVKFGRQRLKVTVLQKGDTRT